MIKWLTIIGLVVIPFAHIEKIVDQAFLKEWLGALIALSIASYALYTKGIRCIDNKWLLFLIGGMLVSTIFVPVTHLFLGAIGKNGAYVFTDLNIDNLWNYQPILFAFLYLLMASAIAKEDWDINEIVNIIAWVGFLTALVVMAQKLGFQQFWRIRDASEIGPGAKNMEITGFMAQYTLVAAFMAICFVSSLFAKKYWFSIVMAAAILITGSHFAIFATIVASALWFGAKYSGSFILILLFVGGLALILNHFMHFNDDGRYANWKQVIHDIRSPLHDVKGAPTQGFTGFGAGAYGLIFPILHKSPWGKAHNEFLECLFNNGIFGLGLFLTAIGVFYRDCFKHFGDRGVRLVLISFTVICILSCGTFPWHLGWGQFYTAVIIGLGYSLIRKEQHELGCGTTV